MAFNNVIITWLGNPDWINGFTLPISYTTTNYIVGPCINVDQVGTQVATKTVSSISFTCVTRVVNSTNGYYAIGY